MRLFIKSILEGGGEGVVLRDGKSQYQHGRSNSMVKLKVFLCHSSYITIVAWYSRF